MLVLDRVSISKVWTHITFAYGFQKRQTLVHRNPLPIANEKHLKYYQSNFIVVDSLSNSSHVFNTIYVNEAREFVWNVRFSCNAEHICVGCHGGAPVSKNKPPWPITSIVKAHGERVLYHVGICQRIWNRNVQISQSHNTIWNRDAIKIIAWPWLVQPAPAATRATSQ